MSLVWKWILTVLLWIGIAVTAVPTAHAQFYSWTNDDGSVGFAEDLGSVPEQYRKTARTGGGENVSVGNVSNKSEEKHGPRKIAREAKKQKQENMVTMEEEKKERGRKGKQRRKDEAAINQAWEYMKDALSEKK